MQEDASLSRAAMAFREHFPPMEDDKIAPEFYQSIKELCLPGKRTAFIVVAHFVHSLPPFMEFLSSNGPVAALIPKGSRVVPEVKSLIIKLYASIVKTDVNKDTFKNVSQLNEFLNSAIFDLRWTEYQFIIIDHGGYFSQLINSISAEFRKRLLGIVEHTWNGELKYRENQPFWLPVRSIARTSLKAKEDDAVAESITDAIRVIYSGFGVNQSITRLNKIALIGYGHIGSKVAQVLFKQLEGPTYYICDTNPVAISAATSHLPYTIITDKKNALSDADLIIVVTSSQVLTREDLGNLKKNACIVCGTSSDDLFTPGALKDFDRVSTSTAEDERRLVTWYRHKIYPNKLICLAADGGSINFIIGSTPHPILHAVLASACVAATKLIKDVIANKKYVVEGANDKDDTAIDNSWLQFYKNNHTHQLNRLKVLLKLQLQTFYSHTYNKIKRFYGEQRPVNECFIDLMKIEVSPKEIPISIKPSMEEEENQNSASQNLTEVKDIFNECSNTTAQRILIIGNPASGKSVVCQFICAYLWAENNEWRDRFDFIFYFELENLTQERYKVKPDSIAEIIHNECLDSSGILGSNNEKLSAQTITDLMRHNPQRVLVLIDGYEKFKNSHSPCLPVIESLLNHKGINIIVTSSDITHLNNREYTSVFRCLGIVNRKKEYLSTLGTNQQNIPLILDFLRAVTAMKGSADHPLVLDMLATSWDESMMMQYDTATINAFCSDMVIKFWFKYVTKNQGRVKWQDNVFLPAKQKELNEFLKLIILNDLVTTQQFTNSGVIGLHACYADLQSRVTVQFQLNIEYVGRVLSGRFQGCLMTSRGRQAKELAQLKYVGIWFGDFVLGYPWQDYTDALDDYLELFNQISTILLSSGYLVLLIKIINAALHCFKNESTRYALRVILATTYREAGNYPFAKIEFQKCLDYFIQLQINRSRGSTDGNVNNAGNGEKADYTLRSMLASVNKEAKEYPLMRIEFQKCLDYINQPQISRGKGSADGNIIHVSNSYAVSLLREWAASEDDTLVTRAGRLFALADILSTEIYLDEKVRARQMEYRLTVIVANLSSKLSLEDCQSILDTNGISKFTEDDKTRENVDHSGLLITTGYIYLCYGQLKEAIKYLKAAKYIRQQIDLQQPRIACINFELVFAYYLRKKYTKVIELATETCQLVRKVFDENSPLRRGMISVAKTSVDPASRNIELFIKNSLAYKTVAAGYTLEQLASAGMTLFNKRTAIEMSQRNAANLEHARTVTEVSQSAVDFSDPIKLLVTL